MRRRRHSQAPPLPHSQAPRAPPFPASMKAPPLGPYWGGIDAQATLIGRGEDMHQKTRPHALIGLGRWGPRSGSIGMAGRYRCQAEEAGWGPGLTSRKVFCSAPSLSAASHGSGRYLLRTVTRIPQPRGTRGGHTHHGAFCLVPFLSPCSAPLTHPGFSQRIPDS